MFEQTCAGRVKLQVTFNRNQCPEYSARSSLSRSHCRIHHDRQHEKNCSTDNGSCVAKARVARYLFLDGASPLAISRVPTWRICDGGGIVQSTVCQPPYTLKASMRGSVLKATGNIRYKNGVHGKVPRRSLHLWPLGKGSRSTQKGSVRIGSKTR